MVKSFVISGCGRSGTMGMAQLLNNAGVPTSFEDFFRRVMLPNDVARYQTWLETAGVAGEVSGLSPPYLKWLPEEILVMHQVRNPVAVVASLMGLRNLHPGSHWLANIRFNFRYLPEMKHSDEPLVLCLKYWLGWNSLIEPRATYRYCIENVSRVRVLQKIFEQMGVKETVPLRQVLNQYETTYNSHKRDTSVSWRRIPEGPLKDAVLTKAISYGYTQQELENYCPLGNLCPHCV